MAYQTNVPNSSQSPGLFPGQGNDNFTRLKTLFGANHKFNDSAATDDGYHQNIKMLPISVPGNDGTVGQGFVNSSDATNQLSFKDGLNNVYQVTPCLPLRAWVIFDPSGTVLNSGNAKFNVTSINVVGTGLFKINFTSAFPSRFYLGSFSVVPTSSTDGLIATTRSSASYGQYITTTDYQLAVRQVSNGSNTSSFIAITAMFFGG
jgi:hypothetical protein